MCGWGDVGELVTVQRSNPTLVTLMPSASESVRRFAIKITVRLEGREKESCCRICIWWRYTRGVLRGGKLLGVEKEVRKEALGGGDREHLSVAQWHVHLCGCKV